VYTSFPHIQRRESVAIRASGYARGFLTACLAVDGLQKKASFVENDGSFALPSIFPNERRP
jgi:hypothetical protein